jgi:beta-aspartyl-peptidase (threonine type)
MSITGSGGWDGGAWSILVHGGAGSVRPEALPRHVEGCRAAAEEGAKILAAGGSALDAAQRAVEVLEDDPSFNAGTGASLNRDGALELDASIMEGTTLRAGAVCALPPFLHPIAIARAALDDGEHILYSGAGAVRFAQSKGFSPASPESMITERAREKWQAARAGEATGWAGGTVGAVARDSEGRVAAATSTGGTSNKRAGRVGDSPILGAGTYADDHAGACSNTGDGEGVMRLCLAKHAIECMRAGAHPEEAARVAVRLLEERVRAYGGIILVDRAGRLGFARTTATMTWGAMAAGWSETLAGS